MGSATLSQPRDAETVIALLGWSSPRRDRYPPLRDSFPFQVSTRRRKDRGRGIPRDWPLKSRKLKASVQWSNQIKKSPICMGETFLV